MKIITVTLVIEIANKISDDDINEGIKEMIGEVFNNEEKQKHPRCKLIVFQIKHDDKI